MNVNVTSDDVWETCEIELFQGPRDGLRLTFRFEATAIGPKGKYAAKTSEKLAYSVGGVFTGKNDWKVDAKTNERTFVRKNCEPKVDALIADLASEGWQPTGRGSEWYNQRFRRKVMR